MLLVFLRWFIVATSSLDVFWCNEMLMVVFTACAVIGFTANIIKLKSKPQRDFTGRLLGARNLVRFGIFGWIDQYF